MLKIKIRLNILKLTCFIMHSDTMIGEKRRGEEERERERGGRKGGRASGRKGGTRKKK